MPIMDLSVKSDYSVFLSYSYKDKEKARLIANELKSSGLAVWYDETELLVGDDITKKIFEGLSASDFLVVLLSPSSVNSGWVRKEWTAALKKELNSRAVLIIPAILEECSIPEELTKFQNIDLETNLTTGIGRLINLIELASVVNLQKLDTETLEELVIQLMAAEGFSVSKPDSVVDQGHDFKISRHITNSLGEIMVQEWLVQLKHYREGRARLSGINRFIEYIESQPALSRGMLISSGQLTTVAEDFLEISKKRQSTVLDVMDGLDIKILLQKHPNLIVEYFLQGKEA